MNASVSIELESRRGKHRVTERGQCLLVTIAPQQLLVPRTLVAEVIPHEGTVLAPSAAGEIRLLAWRGLHVPVLDSALVHADCVPASGEDSRIVVFYGLSNRNRLPYYGVVASHDPRPVTATEENVVPEGDQQNLPLAQAATVMVDTEYAIIPRVDYLEKFILDSGVIQP